MVKIERRQTDVSPGFLRFPNGWIRLLSSGRLPPASSAAKWRPCLKNSITSIVSKDVDALMIFGGILKMDPIAPQNFPGNGRHQRHRVRRQDQIATEGSMQMHLLKWIWTSRRETAAISTWSSEVISPSAPTTSRGSSSTRDNGIAFADYGTAFAAEWYQTFFHDPEGNIIEVHQQVADHRPCCASGWHWQPGTTAIRKGQRGCRRGFQHLPSYRYSRYRIPSRRSCSPRLRWPAWRSRKASPMSEAPRRYPTTPVLPP